MPRQDNKTRQVKYVNGMNIRDKTGQVKMRSEIYVTWVKINDPREIYVSCECVKHITHLKHERCIIEIIDQRKLHEPFEICNLHFICDPHEIPDLL